MASPCTLFYLLIAPPKPQLFQSMMWWRGLGTRGWCLMPGQRPCGLLALKSVPDATKFGDSLTTYYFILHIVIRFLNKPDVLNFAHSSAVHLIYFAVSSILYFLQSFPFLSSSRLLSQSTLLCEKKNSHHFTHPYPQALSHVLHRQQWWNCTIPQSPLCLHAYISTSHDSLDLMTSSLHSSISYIPLHTTTDAESPQSFSITHYLTFHLPYIVPRRISQNQPIHHSFSEKILLCSRQHCRAALCSLHQTHPLLLAIWWHLQPTGMSPRNRLSTWDSSTPCLNKRQAYL